MSQKEQKTAFKVSVVVPAFNEAATLEHLTAKLVPVLAAYPDYEILFVNDGSTDDTLGVLRHLHHTNARIHYLSFSRNFGHQYALKAGLDYADGDAVISMDADLQHPPRLIPRLIEAWQQGYEIVSTQRRETKDEGWFKKTSSRLFYRFFNFMTGLSLPQGAADFRLLDKRVVESVRAIPERTLFLRGMISWIGYNQRVIPYTPAPRFAGKSSYTLKRMLALAVAGATSFSLKPLRMAVYLGLSVAFLGCLLTAYVLYMRLFNGSVISGWASMMCAMLILGGVQLFIMGIIGEYIGMIFWETKRRPTYIISEADLTEERMKHVLKNA